MTSSLSREVVGPLCAGECWEGGVPQGWRHVSHVKRSFPEAISNENMWIIASSVRAKLNDRRVTYFSTIKRFKSDKINNNGNKDVTLLV